MEHIARAYFAAAKTTRIHVGPDFEDVTSDISSMTLQKPLDIVAVNRVSTIASPRRADRVLSA